MKNTAQTQLRQWLDQGGRKVQWLAEQIDAHPSSVSCWLTGARVPGVSARKRIERVTGVPAQAWEEVSA